MLSELYIRGKGGRMAPGIKVGIIKLYVHTLQRIYRRGEKIEVELGKSAQNSVSTDAFSGTGIF